MLQLKPLREAMAALADNDLPQLKAKVKALSEQVQQLKSDITQLEEMLEVEEMDSSTATSLQPDIMMIDRYENEVRDLDKKIAMQAAKLSSGGDTDRSMQQVTSERETVNINLDSVSVSLERTRERLSDHSERVQKLKSTLNDLKSERLTIERDLQRRTQLEERCSELESSNHELTNDIKASDMISSTLQRRISELSRQKEDLAITKERQVDKEKAKQARVSEYRSDLTSRQEEIKRYEREGKEEMLAGCRERLRELEETAEQLSSARDQVTAKIVATRQKLDTQKTQERELEDNMQLRRRQTELDETMRKMGALEEELGGLDVGNLEQERRSLLSQHNRLQERKNHAEGRLHGLREQIQQFKRDLEGDYKGAEKKYMDKKIDLRTTELAQKDLDKYYTALDRAVMSYHKTKMAEINKIIRELWKNTYRGNDIETIEIRSDEEESSGSMRRVYNYRVVMVKPGDTVLDMRGRCSAGQKVLSSLIIRLALAETFCLNCGILALDEPTTNLDRENIESLAVALVQIIKFRSRQCNFQLVVITHDEDFVELLGKSDYVEHFYKVSKNAK
ncbi:hypothetical protein NP493_643g05007 [Ridgeia piscesae]|uniref:DNA repair protein RAD50 n=1 Tax=Ridgeia piscesae TaxID=27915 RepID=A0AAD9KSP6_RIDPI|nr:hypothetical protein NP493_643g05007 [Ridgeia piscesae]